MIILFAFYTLLMFTTGCHDKKNHSTLNDFTANDSIVQVFMERGAQSRIESNYLSSKLNFDSAFQYISPKTDTGLQIQLFFEVSELEKLKGDYHSCLENNFAALKLAKLTNDSARTALSYYNIASTCIFLSRLDDAEKYNTKAIAQYHEIGNAQRLNDCRIQRAVINRKNGQPEKAKNDLSEVITYYLQQDDTTNLAIAYNNYGNILYDQEQYEYAIEYYKKAVQLNKLAHNDYGLAVKYGNIGEVYLIINQPSIGKTYIDSSQHIAISIGAEHTQLYNLERLVDYYKTRGDYQTALTYSEKLSALNQKIQLKKTENTVEQISAQLNNEIKLIEHRHSIHLLKEEKELEAKKRENTLLILFFTIALTLFIIIVSIQLWKQQKRINKTERNYFEKERESLVYQEQLAKEKIHIQNIEKKRLEDELEHKRKDLLIFSKTLHEREAFLQQLKSQLTELKTKNTTAEQITKIQQEITQLKLNGESELFSKIESINQSFYYRLEKKFPQLTKDDLRLAGLVILGLSAKEIANLLVIAPKSVDMKRYRLKKKLELDSETDLSSFLINL